MSSSVSGCASQSSSVCCFRTPRRKPLLRGQLAGFLVQAVQRALRLKAGPLR